MKEARCGVLHGLHDFGMPVARGRDGDSRHEIEEAVAVHILDHRALAARDREWILLRIRRGGVAVLPLDDGPGLGTRWRHDDARVVASRSGAHVSITVRLCSRMNCAT